MRTRPIVIGARCRRLENITCNPMYVILQMDYMRRAFQIKQLRDMPYQVNFSFKMFCCLKKKKLTFMKKKKAGEEVFRELVNIPPPFIFNFEGGKS